MQEQLAATWPHLRPEASLCVSVAGQGAETWKYNFLGPISIAPPMGHGRSHSLCIGPFSGRVLGIPGRGILEVQVDGEGLPPFSAGHRPRATLPPLLGPRTGARLGELPREQPAELPRWRLVTASKNKKS